MTAEREIVEVEQIDREMAAPLVGYYEAEQINHVASWKSECLAGVLDGHRIVQAFARHRINVLAASERTKDHG